MSVQDIYENAKAGNGTDFYLAKGNNIIRFLTAPKMWQEAFCISEQKDEKGVVKLDTNGKPLMINRSEPIYDGCGYEDSASKKFVSYVIDANDQLKEDGTPKIKVLGIGWKTLEQFAKQEEMREAQGLGVFSFPMTLDVIINKSGEGFSTSYSLAIMQTETANKITIPNGELGKALMETESINDYLAKQVKDAKERHARFGKPKGKKQVEAESKAKEAELPVVNIDEETFPMPTF